MNAVREGYVDCARLLLEAGADKEAKDKVRISRYVTVEGLLALRKSEIAVLKSST